MPDRLRREIKQRRPLDSPEMEAFLNLHRTTGILVRQLNLLLKGKGVSLQQYNVLRILRGSKGVGLTCGEIHDRMVSPDPDVTRMLDRLEKQGLVERGRCAEDRRRVLTTITSDGLVVLGQLDGPVRDAHRGQLGHLTGEQLRSLIELLELVRDPQPDDGTIGPGAGAGSPR